MTPITARVFYAASNDPHQCLDADIRALADLMRRCVTSQGRWFSLHCLSEKLRAFTGPRFMSVVALSALVVGGLCMIG
jgi:hypothetical protein